MTPLFSQLKSLTISREKKNAVCSFWWVSGLHYGRNLEEIRIFFPESFVRYAEISQLHVLCTTGFFLNLFLNFTAIPTVLFGVGGSGRILSRMG